MSLKSLLLYAAGTPNGWKATVFVEYDSIYKLVVDKDRAGRGRSGTRAGFGATGS